MIYNCIHILFLTQYSDASKKEEKGYEEKGQKDCEEEGHKEERYKAPQEQEIIV